MPIAIFALAAVNFAVGTQGFVFAGLLPDLAADLGVSIGQAGLLVAASTITFAIGAPFAARLVSGIERRSVIVAALLVLSAANAMCALAPSFETLALLRILGGVATAFIGALATVAAAALVPAAKRGRAFAFVMGGLTVAFVLGVPLGSAIGGVYGWRATFVFAALVSLSSLVLITLTVPVIKPAGGRHPRLVEVLSNVEIVHVLGLTLLAFTATFTVVAFLGPIITATTGATGAGVGVFQAFIGLGSIAGLAAGGVLADRHASKLATSAAFAVMAVSLCVYWVVISAPQHSVPAVAMAALIFVGAAALFLLIPINLARLATTAGAAAPIALALNGSLVSLGQGVGAIWGGFLTDHVGAAAMGFGGATIAAIGLVLSFRSISAAGEIRPSGSVSVSPGSE